MQLILALYNRSAQILYRWLKSAKFFMKPNVCASSVSNLLPITHLVYRILRWLLDYRKICAPMLCS